MFKNIDYSKILFFDIETVPQTYDFNDLDHRGKELWDKKSKYVPVSYTHLTLPTIVDV